MLLNEEMLKHRVHPRAVPPINRKQLGLIISSIPWIVQYGRRHTDRYRAQR